ncbi:MAG TPA: GNAT family N-acetyltransferase [Amycolatopsis sp.]|nr:GNAT family N-acetyltransferase [Amycolatopsis sp.]
MTFAETRTGRLLLRALTEADRQTVIRIQAEARGVAEAQFDSWLEDWAHFGFGYVAAIERATGELVGVGGVRLREWNGEKILNLYYRFVPTARGRGCATEMSRAVIDWADRTVPHYPVQISVDVRNVASLKVAGRLGFDTYLDVPLGGPVIRHFRRS